MAWRAWRPDAYRWSVHESFGGADELARKLGTTPLVAQVLHNRGIDSAEAGRAFMKPRLGDLHDPSELSGAVQAAVRIARAVAEKQRIVIYGDYDVDGMTGVAILYAILTMLGADVHYYVPHRLDEGYGVNAKAIEKLIARDMNLLITVDCGISAVKVLSEATKAGVDVIVTDHHSPPDQLPEVAAIVHPDIPQGSYPNPALAGAGVAFKLAWQVARAVCGSRRVDEPMKKFLLDATCLAALGTIADVVNLRGENRVLAVFGLAGLPATDHPGLRALLESASLATGKLDAYDVGFRLAPRLNACGRMGHARLAVELLTTASPDRCREIATYLNTQNTQRQKVQREITEKAVEMVLSRGLDAKDNRAIVLSSPNWHGGVIGIVASRIVERFNRPTILIAINGDGQGQGSGRSVPGFHMRDALAASGKHLQSFGGHAMAGGIRIDPANIDAFAEDFCRCARENLPDDAPALDIDAETTLASLNFTTVQHLSRLAPFGQGNPPPLLILRNCELPMAPKRMGRQGATASLYLKQGSTSLRAVGFGMGDLADKLIGVSHVDVAAEATLNTYRGKTNVELHLRDVQW